MSNKNISRPKAWWGEFLSIFNFKLTYQPGKAGGKSDVQTRQSQDKPDLCYEVYQNRMTMLSTPILLVEEVEKSYADMHLLSKIPLETGWMIFLKLLDEAYHVDPFSAEILKMLEKRTCYSRKIALTGCSELQGWLLYQGRVWVQESSKLHLRQIQSQHNSSEAEHMRTLKTLKLLPREF